MKKVLIISAVVIVLVVAGVYLLISNLDSLIAQMIEKSGSEATGTKVSVAGVDISLKEGRGSVMDLTVGNPEGFSPGEAFSLDDITLDIDVNTIREDPIVIEEIRVSAPVVFAEITESGSSNIEKLQKNIRERSRGKASEGGGKEGKRVAIRRFIFEKGRIEVDASALGVKKRTIDLPGIRLDRIGGEEGAYPADIAGVILKEIVQRTAYAIGRSEVEDIIEKNLEKSGAAKAKKLLDRIGN